MNKLNWMSGFIITALAVPAFSQNVPALDKSQNNIPHIHADAPLPAIHMLSANRVKLSAKENYGVRLAAEWKAHPNKPRRGADGSVKYLFGATLPTMVCTPLEVCSIELQPGEIVNDVHAGDSARWKISPATMGSGAKETTVIIVKPTDAGLLTNLTVTTDRRLYTIKLVSTHKKWIPVLSFDYPEEVNREWEAYHNSRVKQIDDNTLANGRNVASLDFDFHIDGDNPKWRPKRIYSDGIKTYIQFASANFGGDAPALVALGKDGGLFSSSNEQIVNYRVIGDCYVVDKVIERAALITGVGSAQVKVTITHRSS